MGSIEFLFLLAPHLSKGKSEEIEKRDEVKDEDRYLPIL